MMLIIACIMFLLTGMRKFIFTIFKSELFLLPHMHILPMNLMNHIAIELYTIGF